MYATKSEKHLAYKYGYGITENIGVGTRFKQGDRHIWSVDMRWVTADLDNGAYCNHQYYTDLEDALARPLCET